MARMGHAMRRGASFDAMYAMSWPDWWHMYRCIELYQAVEHDV